MDDQPVNSSPDETASNSLKSRRLLRKVLLRARRKVPWLIPDPDYADMCRIHRKGDAAKNEASCPPPEESVVLHCFWAMEYYPPAHAKALLDGLASLGWDKDDVGANCDVADWVRRLRETANSGGFINLSTITRPQDKSFISIGRKAPLPEFCAYAFGQISSLTPSITCVMMAFVPKHDYHLHFDSALRLQRETATVPLGRGYTIKDPASLKAADISDLRSQFRDEARAWFKQHLPGSFSSRLDSFSMPTCELLTLKLAKPFPTKAAGAPRPAQYLDLLGVDNDIDAWESERLPGLYFSWPIRRDKENPNHAILAASESTLSTQSHYSVGDEAPASSFPARANDHCQHLLQLWGLTSLLRGLQTDLSSLRDANLLGAGARSALRQLRAIANLSSANSDVSNIASDLVSSETTRPIWALYVEKFNPVNKPFNGEKRLLDRLIWVLPDRARRVQGAERLVRDYVVQQSAIVSAYENVKLQRSIHWLTVFIAILTVAAVVLAAENSTIVKSWFGPSQV